MNTDLRTTTDEHGFARITLPVSSSFRNTFDISIPTLSEGEGGGICFFYRHQRPGAPSMRGFIAYGWECTNSTSQSLQL